MPIEIRELVTGDEVALLDLFETVLSGFASAAPDLASGPAAFLADPATFALGAYVDSLAAGLAWGVQMRYPNGRLVTYLHELDVLERFRRRGIGTALVEQAMELARRQESTRFWLSTGGPNSVAQALYESLGGDRKPQGDVNYWWELPG